MTIFSAILLTGLAVLNWRRSRSVLFPPVLFCLLWAGILLGLTLSEDDFYRLSASTLFICFLGCLSFSTGFLTVRPRGGPGMFKRWQVRSVKQDRLTLRAVDTLLVIFMGLLPMYWNTLTSIEQGSRARHLFQAVRTEMVASATGQAVGLGVFNYILAFILVMTMIVATESCRLSLSKWRLVLWVGLALAYYIPTGSRLGAMVVLVGVCFILAFVGHKISRNTVLLALSIPLVFSFAAIALEKGGSQKSSFMENTQSIASSFQLYSLGGLVAFDQELQNPHERPGKLPSFRFFYAVADALGFPSSLPNIVLPDVATPQLTNVYTVYHNYVLDFGWSGMCAAFLVLGAVFARLYSSATSGRPEAVALLGLGCAYLVFTCAGDPFLIGLSACIQAVLQVMLIYTFPRMLMRGSFAPSPTHMLYVRRGVQAFRNDITRHYRCELEHACGSSDVPAIN